LIDGSKRITVPVTGCCSIKQLSFLSLVGEACMPRTQVWVGLRFLCLSILVLISLGHSASAQQATGTILGTVSDPQGAVIPDASVTATNSDTNFTRTVPTGSDGAYRISNLPVGNYEVRITKDGFETNDRKGLVLEVGAEAVVNVAMTVGTTSQTVEVSSSSVPLVETTSSAVGGVVDEQRVADLPLNGRNWSQLSLLQAGVAQSFLTQPSPTGGNGGFGGGTVFVANGATPRANNYMLDGAYLGTMWGFNGSSATGNSLGIDGIQEFRVVTSLFSAEYALAGGSQTIIASKAGTNAFHGSGFEYLRNSSLDARNYFDALDPLNVRGFGTDKSEAFPDKRLPPFHRSDFGGSFGGPIKKDKTFFYATYERLVEHKGLSTIDTTLPPACFTNGTFDGVINPTLPASCAPFLTQAQIATLPSNSVPYVNPTTGQITITPVIQEMIMKSESGGALNPALFPSGALWPAPNLVGPNPLVNNYTFPAIQDTIEQYGQLRFDQTFSASDSAFVRYTHDQAFQDIPGAFIFFHGIQTSIGQFITASESHVFSPNFLQTLRFSLSHSRIGLNTLGEPGDNQKSLVNQNGPGAISVTGYTGPGVPLQPSNYYQDVFMTSDDYVWTKGKHSFKIGALWGHWVNPNAGVKFLSHGSIGFANLSQFFTSQYSSISYEPPTTNLTETTAYNTIGFYVQDDYRFTPRLTLNLGLRYEFATTPYGPDNNVYSLRSTLTAQPPNFGILGAPYSNAATHHNFSPRIGFAWDVFGTGKTAVRGGGGVYYDVGNQGQLAAAVNYDTPPRTYDYGFSNPVINQLATTASGVGILDTFTLARNGCADISNPLKPPCTIAGVDYNFQQPSRGQWNLTVDQQLPWQMAVSVSYVGSVGWHLWTQIDQNYENATILANGSYTSAVQTDSRGYPIYCVAEASGICQFSDPALNGGLSTTAQAAAISGLAFHRVNPTLGESDWELAAGRSWYHSLQVVVNKRISKGLQFQNAFTWSKNMDNAVAGALGDSAINAVVPTGPNPHSLNYNDAPAAYDIALNDRFNTIYHFGNLSGNGILEKFTNGWWMSSIITAQTGYPFNVTISGNRLLGVSQIGSIVPNRAANYNPNTVIIGKQTEWFDPTQFSLPTAGTDGSAGRDFLRGPGLANVDLSFVKDTKVGWLGEAGSVQFRAEIFNILNRANFALPSSAVYSLAGGAAQASTPSGQIGASGLSPLGTAGLISSTVTTSRQIQLALKVTF
jgi:hypothetical protein